MSQTKEIAAREAKNHFGELLDSAQRGPVRITKNGRKVAVILSEGEYKRFEDMEDALWAARAVEAEKNDDFLGPKKSEAFLKKVLSADADA